MRNYTVHVTTWFTSARRLVRILIFTDAAAAAVGGAAAEVVADAAAAAEAAVAVAATTATTTTRTTAQIVFVFRLSKILRGMSCSAKAILIIAPVIISVILQGIYFCPQSFWT